VKLVANSMYDNEERNEAGILSSGSRTTKRFESVVESQNGDLRIAVPVIETQTAQVRLPFIRRHRRLLMTPKPRTDLQRVGAKSQAAGLPSPLERQCRLSSLLRIVGTAQMMFQQLFN
jgi:hypothetical protein